MIIVSDTTPIHYLILIDEAELLPQLFGAILIPEAVFAEMSHENTPDKVKNWVLNLPDWIKIKSPLKANLTAIQGLGKGETEAIALAVEEKADAVLMDDRKAIREARKNNLLVITLFAVLEMAAIKNLIDLRQAIDELAKTSFRLPPDEIVADFLKRDYERKMF